MEAYHFKTVVAQDGSIVLSGLPPSQEVEVIVVERKGLSDEMRAWFQDIRTRHPFAKMSKAEILKALQETRETVWAERHAN
ncbi:MAG: hypothetical protein U0350_42290 [Caldilineaceae bacterium]